MGRRVAYIVVIFLLVTGCRKEVQKISSESGERIFAGSYSVIENYEVAEGPHAGFQGSSSYAIHVREDNERHILLFENIANAYTVAGIQSGDSVFLEKQKFPYHNESVIISGKGKLSGDSLFLEIYSGGPAGQITSVCRAKKLHLK